MRMKTILACACAMVAANCASEDSTATMAANEAIGASLAEKTDIDIADVPDGVLEVARAARPDIDFTDAEREVRNGVVYFDVEGEDPQGREIELDIMQDEETWRVVEVQRDISMAAVPDAVRDALFENAPGIEPARIIESDQTDGVIIYEFFVVREDGAEEKHEVKFDGARAEYLDEEWAH